MVKFAKDFVKHVKHLQKYCFENTNWHKQNVSGPLAQILEELYQTIAIPHIKAIILSFCLLKERGHGTPIMMPRPCFFIEITNMTQEPPHG